MKWFGFKRALAEETAALSISVRAYSYRFLLSLCLLVMVCYCAWMRSAMTNVFVLNLLALVFCADVLLRNAWQDIGRKKITVSVFVCLSVVGAFLYNLSKTFFLHPLAGIIPSLSVWMSLILSLYLWNCLLNARRKERTFVFIKKLDDFLPKSGRLTKNNQEQMVFARELVPGNLIQVLAGETIPCDGIIEKGSTSIDEGLVTGNMLPAVKTQGHVVYAGTLNKKADITVRVQKVLDESVVAGIIQAIKKSERRRCVRHSLLDEYAWMALLWALALGVGGYAYAYWNSGFSRPLHSIGIILLAFGLSCPVSFFLSTWCPVLFMRLGALRKKINLRAWDALEVWKKADTVFFDKTGTLTYGELRVIEIHPASQHSQDQQELLECLASAEQQIEGPFAQAIMLYAQEQHAAVRQLKNYEYFPGLGVHACVDKDDITAGRASWLQERGIKIGALPQQPHATVCVAKNGVYLGYVSLADKVRPGMKEMVQCLKRKGKEVILMSGDTAASASLVAQVAGIEKVNAEVLPQTKAEIISNYIALGKTTVMVGDGFNDITALLHADAGIVFSSGKNVYNNWVDIIIHRQDLNSIVELFAIHKRLRFCILGNLILSFLCAGALLASTFWVSEPLWGSHYALPVGMAVGIVLVFLNSVRLMYIK